MVQLGGTFPNIFQTSKKLNLFRTLVSIKNQFYAKLRKYYRIITNFQQQNFQHWRNFITYENIESIL